MNCPKCNAPMQRVELEQVVGVEVFENWECSACGFRQEIKRETPKL